MSDAVRSPLVVLLASVLKPVDDTRMRGKFAETLRQRPGTVVHIAGRRAGAPAPQATQPNVFQHSLFAGSRLSPGRLLAQWRFWCLLRRLGPDVVIVHAPELLPLTLLWRGLAPGRRFIYDVRENYALNVSTQHVYGRAVRQALAAGLRFVESWAARRAAGVVVAEISYLDELPFLTEAAGPVLVLENKYQPQPGERLPTRGRQLPTPAEPLRLLYSGTISDLNGVWEAVALAESLQAARPGEAHLTIVGFCQQPALLRALQRKVAAHPHWLRLVGGPEPVPHARIVAEIQRSHLGLLPYRPHPSTERCRPTKLFEYLAHGLPMLVSPNPLWLAQVERYAAGRAFDFAAPPPASELLASLQGRAFYPAGVPTDVLWAEEGKKLWPLLDSSV